jgi:phenylalanyl-tRNA synthetase beta chain
LGKLAGLGRLSYIPIQQHQSLHPGKSAAIFNGDKQIGYIGEIHPRVAKALNIIEPVWCFELNFSLLEHGEQRKFCCIPKFPGIRRDLAIIVDKQVIAYDIENTVKKRAGDLLQDFCIFDIYCGHGIDQGKKSIGLGIMLQHPSRTLVDDEIKQIMENIIVGLKLEFGAVLR